MGALPSAVAAAVAAVREEKAPGGGFGDEKLLQMQRAANERLLKAYQEAGALCAPRLL
jgi:hypothetical protein